MQVFFVLVFVVLVCCVALTNAFSVRSHSKLSAYASLSTSLRALSTEAMDKLSEIKDKYTKLSNVDSPEADSEASNLKETVDKYNTYLEVNALMVKIKAMHENEASERRQGKQIKSFMDLYKGKCQLETVLLGKLGMPATTVEPIGIEEVLACDAKIAALESKMDEVKIVLPEGTSTRAARFDH